MLFNIGDLVTRTSYNNDLVFRITKIENDIAELEGINIRLLADSPLIDLNICKDCLEDITKEDRNIEVKMEKYFDFNRDSYFYIPGKILHIDSDKYFLERCTNFYKKMNISSFGITIPENKMYLEIKKHLEDINPDVLIITGHDAYYDKHGDDLENLKNYKNSNNFVKAVKKAREYEKDHEKLIIIAGACQSNYEQLIKAGSNFASSPKRVNIHALDPSIIGVSVCLSSKNKLIDLKSILERTKYGKDGIGGIITNGTMYVGYPR